MSKNKITLEKGYVQVYMGNGKGKTTAALGLAFRAMGRGLKTYIGQFMKGQFYAEIKSGAMVQPYITIEQYGSKDTHVQKPPSQEDIRLAQEGLSKAREAMLSGEYELVIFDEINTAHFYQLISTKDMLDLVAAKPDKVEIVFTGRYAPPEIINAADLVTEMKEVKHYFHKGILAREGIER